MRYVYVIQQYLPRIGGAEIAVERQMQALQAQGHTAELVTLRLESAWARHEIVHGIPVTRVGGIFWRGRLRLRSALMLVALARMALALWPRLRRTDVVHVSMIAPFSALAAMLARWRKLPVLLMIHTLVPTTQAEPGPQRLLAGPLDPDLACLQVPASRIPVDEIDVLRHFYPWLAGWALRALQQPHVQALALTTAMRDHLVSLGFAPGQIQIVPNRVGPAAFAVERRVSAPPQVLCIARHSYEKGIDILLQAWAIVQQQRPDARLILLGDGPLHDQLQAMARHLGIAASVEFRGAMRATPPLMAEAACFVQPSRWEGFGLALVEAMAAGIPCVSTRVGIVGEMAPAPAEQPLLVVEGPQAMAEAILRLLNHPESATRIGQAGQAVARARYQQ